MAAVRLQHNIAAAQLSRTEGGSRDRRVRASRCTSTPTDIRILALQLLDPDLGPGAMSQGRGVEKLKETEHIEIDARGRISRRRCC